MHRFCCKAVHGGRGQGSLSVCARTVLEVSARTALASVADPRHWLENSQLGLMRFSCLTPLVCSFLCHRFAINLPLDDAGQALFSCHRSQAEVTLHVA
jgi:hypothetical protein